MYDKIAEILTNYGLAGVFIGVTLLFIRQLWTALSTSNDLYEETVIDSRNRMEKQIEAERENAERWKRRYLDEVRRRQEEYSKLKQKYDRDQDEMMLYMHKLEHKLDNN